MSHRLPTQDRDRIQAIVGSGFGTMRFSEYVLLEIESGRGARAWLAQVLARDSVWTVRHLKPQRSERRLFTDEGQEAWSIAFTHRGLGLLGIEEDPQAPFPSEFKAGQADAARRLMLREAPHPWQWGDVEIAREDGGPEAVSILVVRMHDGEQARPHPLLDTSCLARHGLRLVRRIHGSPGSLKSAMQGGKPVRFIEEPFGFRDGMGQPRVEGLLDFRSDGRALEAGPSVPLGEFVLGHVNAYGEQAHCPAVKTAAGEPAGGSFGRNGSYLAVQQILQDVEAFRAFDEGNRASGNEPSVAEKMIGRRKNGCPLQEIPDALGPDDDFGYRMNDPDGMQCPLGAHVRRANPRDSVLVRGESRPEPGNLHRLLRRGRPYAIGDGRDDAGPAERPVEVGMFFIAVVADLARQFEFVKRAWIGNPTFGNLCGETDPLLGWGQGRHFTMPGQPGGSRVHGLPDLTRTQGGGYFFLPSLDTLQGIAQGRYTGPRERPGDHDGRTA